MNLTGLAGGQSARELFVADSENRVVRSINISAASKDLELHQVYRLPKGENLKDIAYSSQSDTLLVVSSAPHTHHFTLRSLTRPTGNFDWIQRYSIDIKSRALDNRCTLRTLSDGRLVFGVWGAILEPAGSTSRSQLPTQTVAVSCHKENKLGDVLKVLTLDESRKIQEKYCAELPAPHSGFDAKLTGNKDEILVAAALWFDTVALYRVVEERVDRLASVTYEYAQMPLFYRENLLLCRWPDSTSDTATRPEVLELSVSGDRIELIRKLGDIKLFWFTTWCTVPEGVVAWGFEPGLNLYSLA